MVPSLCRPRQGSNTRKIIESNEKWTRKIYARRKFSPPSPFPVPPPDTWTNFLNGPFFSNSSKNCRATPWGCCFEQPQNKSDLHCDCKDWIPEILLESHLVSSIFTLCSSAAILCMLIGPPCLYKKKNGNFLSRKSDKILLFIDFLVLWAVCHQHSRMFPGFSLVALSSAQIF